MTVRSWHALCCRIASGLAISACAHAQFAVIDATSVAQLVRQSASLAQQLATERAQLLQLQAQFASLSGSRGMQGLLAGTVRNYLPSDGAALQALMEGRSGSPGTLSRLFAQRLQGTGLLSDAQLAMLPAANRSGLQTARSSLAMREAVADEALANASQRFASLQQLIGALGAAADPKSVLDLQARIQAEQSMLLNEQTKLQTLFQAEAARESVQVQRSEEAAIAAQGRFETRFEPVPR